MWKSYKFSIEWTYERALADCLDARLRCCFFSDFVHRSRIENCAPRKLTHDTIHRPAANKQLQREWRCWIEKCHRRSPRRSAFTEDAPNGIARDTKKQVTKYSVCAVDVQHFNRIVDERSGRTPFAWKPRNSKRTSRVMNQRCGSGQHVRSAFIDCAFVGNRAFDLIEWNCSKRCRDDEQ